MSSRGREPKRPLTGSESQHLRLLYELQNQSHRYKADLEDFALACQEDGTSVRRIAETLHVGASTVQGWIGNAKGRRKPTG